MDLYGETIRVAQEIRNKRMNYKGEKGHGEDIHSKN